jgi:hypothetical protein
MDGNGVNDFQFFIVNVHYSHYTDAYCVAGPLSNDSNALLIDSLTSNFSLALRTGDSIGANRPLLISQPAAIPFWSSRFRISSDQLVHFMYGDWTTNYSVSSDGYWNTPYYENDFLGVRFLDSTGQTHYGWIHLRCFGSSKIVIINWAYESQPDSSIIAGDGWVAGIQSAQHAEFANVYSSDNVIYVHLNFTGQATISIFDDMGQLIRKEENISSDAKIEMEGVAPGIYFVEVVEGEKVFTQKIYLQ